MFGLMEAMLSFLRRQVGLRTDDASSTGSLHAKVGELRSQVLIRKKPQGAAGAMGSFSTYTDVWATALNVSGAGRLIGLKLHQNSGGNTSVRVTVDGFLLADVTSSLDNPGYSYPGDNFYMGDGFITTGKARNAEISFKSSLKLELKSAFQGQTSTLYWLYEKE